MKNEDEIWQWLTNEINKVNYADKFPHEIEITCPFLDFDGLFGYLKILQKNGAITIQAMGEDVVKDIKIPKSKIQVNRIITEEYYKVLWCGDLMLNLISGKAKYKKEAICKKGTQQYIFLQYLMSNPNKNISLEKIANLLNFEWKKGMKNETTKRRIYDLVRDIKKKLNIKKEDDLIIANNGYRLKCF